MPLMLRAPTLCLLAALLAGCASASASGRVTSAVDEAPAALQPGAEPLSFFLGDWDVEVFDAGGRRTHRARTRARAILDGHGLADDWRALDETGRVIFRGTSLRCFVPATGRWTIHWVMADAPGYTYLEADWVDGEFLAEGHGFDGSGEFLERLRYSHITGTEYELVIERSYDGGQSYRLFSRLLGHKRA